MMKHKLLFLALLLCIGGTELLGQLTPPRGSGGATNCGKGSGACSNGEDGGRLAVSHFFDLSTKSLIPTSQAKEYLQLQVKVADDQQRLLTPVIPQQLTLEVVISSERNNMHITDYKVALRTDQIYQNREGNYFWTDVQLPIIFSGISTEKSPSYQISYSITAEYCQDECAELVGNTTEKLTFEKYTTTDGVEAYIAIYTAISAELNQEVIAYPNPSVDGRVHFQFSSTNLVGRMNLIAQDGKSLASINLSKRLNDKGLTIDLEDYGIQGYEGLIIYQIIGHDTESGEEIRKTGKVLFQ